MIFQGFKRQLIFNFMHCASEKFCLASLTRPHKEWKIVKLLTSDAKGYILCDQKKEDICKIHSIWQHEKIN